jgi:hypothetical protein
MIVPLDTAAAQPPPPAGAARDHQRRRQPEALDPELEARLRRQRAQQYGHSVRENLAAWHQRFSSRRQEQLTAQRAEWEAQRAARLARLADKHQVGAFASGLSAVLQCCRPAIVDCTGLNRVFNLCKFDPCPAANPSSAPHRCGAPGSSQY